MPPEPNPSEQLTQRGEMLLERHRPQEAEDFFRQALAANPDNDDAHFGLARCLAQDSRRPHKALEEIELALALEPNWPGYHAFRGIILTGMGRTKEARQSVASALELDPDNAYSWYCTALIERAEEKWEAMEQAARKALELDPDESDYTNLLAESLTKQHRREEAGDMLRDALRSEPENADTHAQLGWNLLPQDRAKAEEHFYEALRLNPHSDPARKGMLEAFKGRNWFYRSHQKIEHGVRTLLHNRLFWKSSVLSLLGLILLFVILILIFPAQKFTFAVALGIILGLFVVGLILTKCWLFVSSYVGCGLILLDQRARLALTFEELFEAVVTIILGAVATAFLIYKFSSES